MAGKKDSLEPAVRITRKCDACGSNFTLCHPNDPKQLCEKCRETLALIIMERREHGHQNNDR